MSDYSEQKDLLEKTKYTRQGGVFIAPGFRHGDGFWQDDYIAYGKQGDDSQTFDFLDSGDDQLKLAVAAINVLPELLAELEAAQSALAIEQVKSARLIKEAKKQDHMLWESIFFEEDGQPVIHSKEFDWNIIEDFSDFLDELAPEPAEEVAA